MTWQGGKAARQLAPLSPFARLRPLAREGDGPAEALQTLSSALSAHPAPARLEIRLLSGAEQENMEHWQIQVGSDGSKPQQSQASDADVIVVMRPETWMQIAKGELAPYEALYTGKLRVGGDFEAAKEITRSLSDPASPYVSPC